MVSMNKVPSSPVDIPETITKQIAARGGGNGSVRVAPKPSAGLFRVEAERPQPHRLAAVPIAIEAEASMDARGGQHGAKYGPPQEEFHRIARAWAAILGVSVSAEQVALCMVSSKLQELVAKPDDHQSMVDTVGYLICLQRVVEGD